MKKLLIVIVAIAVCVWLASDMWARGGRGGGGGGGGGRGGGGGASTRRWWRCAPEWWCIEGWRWRIAQCCFPDAVDVAAEYFERSKTEWQRGPSRKQSAIDGYVADARQSPERGGRKSTRRWQRCFSAECRYSSQWRQRGQSTECGHSARRRQRGQSAQRGYSARRWGGVDRRIKTSSRSHDHRLAMCKTFLICRMRVVGMLAVAGPQADSVTRLRSPVARWLAARRPSS